MRSGSYVAAALVLLIGFGGLWLATKLAADAGLIKERG